MIRLPTTEAPGFVAELGQCGGADVARYVDMVEAFAAAGVWGVKVQMIDPERLASPTARPYWSTTRYAATQAESFAKAGCVPHDGWAPVREACERCGVAFLATPFDLGAISPLLDLNPDAVKVASGDLTYGRMLDAVTRTFTQVVVATGGATGVEVRAALAHLMRGRAPRDPGVMLLACSLQYPTPDASANLARLDALRRTHAGPVGLSDHTVQTTDKTAFAAGVAAGVMGAALVEKHCASLGDGDEWAAVPDLDMAMTPWLAAEYADGLRYGSTLRGAARLDPHRGEADAVVGARRSLHLVAPLTGALPAGHVLTADDFVALRPGGGVDLSTEYRLVGKTLLAPVAAGVVVAALRGRDLDTVELKTRND